MILQRYVAARVGLHAALLLAAGLAGWAGLDFLGRAEEFVERWPDRWAGAAAAYYLWHAPGWAAALVAPVLFAAALATGTEMRRLGEMEGLLLSGRPPVRHLRTAAAAAALLGVLLALARVSVIAETDRRAQNWKEALLGFTWREQALAWAGPGTSVWAGTVRTAPVQALGWTLFRAAPDGREVRVESTDEARPGGAGTWTYRNGQAVTWAEESGFRSAPAEGCAIPVRGEDLAAAAGLRRAPGALNWLRDPPRLPSRLRTSFFEWARLWVYPVETAALLLLGWQLAAGVRRGPAWTPWLAGVLGAAAFLALEAIGREAARLGAAPPAVAAAAPAAAILAAVAALRARVLGMPFRS